MIDSSIVTEAHGQGADLSARLDEGSKSRVEDHFLRGEPLLITGPYGTQIKVAVKEDPSLVPKLSIDTSVVDVRLDWGCSALLTSPGREKLEDIAVDYLQHSSSDQSVVLVTPSFRLSHKILLGTSYDIQQGENLAHQGLELTLASLNVATRALQKSGRSSEQTLLAMSIGPSFNCYDGDTTPANVADEYLPSVFAAVRYGQPIDYIMFETTPSLEAAIGAARAFQKAHKRLDVTDVAVSGDDASKNVLTYLGFDLQNLEQSVPEGAVCDSYDSERKTFTDIKPTKGYLISLWLDQRGTLNGTLLDNALTQLYTAIGDDEHFLGVGLNCTSPYLIDDTLKSLTSANRSRIISIHPNASSDIQPDSFGQNPIERDRFTLVLNDMYKDPQNNLKIVGACCGSNKEHMRLP